MGLRICMSLFQREPKVKRGRSKPLEAIIGLEMKADSRRLVTREKHIEDRTKEQGLDGTVTSQAHLR